MSKVIKHYGILRRSGRYPWGSGGDNFLSSVDRLSKKGLSEVEIAKSFGLSTTELRNKKTLAKAAAKENKRSLVSKLKETGMSTSAIAKETGIAESSIRDLLAPVIKTKQQIIQTVANVLRKSVERFKYVDVGEGVEQFLGVSQTKLKNALALLQDEGYTIHYLREEQLGTGKKTSYKILAAPGTSFSEVYKNRIDIGIPNHVSEDYGRSFYEMDSITNVKGNRVLVRYAEDGGAAKDGLIELRRGPPELSLGNKKYAQVRIGVDGTHYLKGMALHTDDIPDGYDMVFYTSKAKSPNKLEAFKEQNLEDTNPFGTTVKQKTYIDSNGKTQISALNIVYEEGNWSTWSKSLSSQFLSKQSPKLAKEQLELELQKYKAEYDEIQSLTNPVVKQHLLQGFSDNLDSAAVHLKAASLPKQTTSVLLPEPSMKPTEVYAPNYANGTSVVLVRYPHGGIFELPTLTVNNKNPNAKATIASAKDAIMIHPDVAKRLSGADFDGDTVLVIPNPRGKIRTAPALESLKGFDPIAAYPPVPGMRKMSPEGKQLKMGDVTNLITDMTVRGAPHNEIARAVKHSMVVIDAEKHNLNYVKSYEDNGIAALKNKYQGSARSGAATLISRASSQQRVPHRKDNYAIDPNTGEKIFSYTGKTYISRDGREVLSTTKSTKMYEAKDAKDLSSGTVIEGVYASYANRVKTMANNARLSMINTKPIPYSPSARQTYKKETQSLDAKLRAAIRNQPLERKAQLVAAEMVRAQQRTNPSMSRSDLQTAKGKALVVARTRIGAKKPTIQITPREWEGIQMGAVSPTKLKRILRNSDMEHIKQLATPRDNRGLSTGKVQRARLLLQSGYSAAEVAVAIGASQSQIINLDLD